MESNGIPVGGISLAQIEQSRKQMHQKIDAQYDELVRKILMDGKQLTIEDVINCCLWQQNRHGSRD